MDKQVYFFNRREAGIQLAQKLKKLAHENPCVLALPRGGVPVATEIALALSCDLDLLLIKRITSPFHPEVAVGAIAPDGTTIWNRRLLGNLKLSKDDLQDRKAQKLEEVVRQSLQWKRRLQAVSVEDRTVILVDDGIATGVTIRIAIQVVKREGAKRVIVATPVAAPRALNKLRKYADEVIVLRAPEHFVAVEQFYEDFSKVEDGEVIKNLQRWRGLNALRNRGSSKNFLVGPSNPKKKEASIKHLSPRWRSTGQFGV